MGQSSSQVLEGRAPTPEPDISPEERARMQAEERERRAAAAQQRFETQQKRKGAAAEKKKMSALEQMSKENRGWRVADEQAELRAYN
ncbi:hypothetical protein BU26DRAFT_521818 [Trematosphaeria pertusa]|uniref:Uncharacterized protein n=1 Tax=Trematosphaeria pertusa TaxID=390896 RepID=A0A6A6I536_9PLEO|nr:uncharacterized protein BU26DRAFT_521818 [Trematosphaeria pertusa]KAF2245339.1 hypothetical protein BU26DRAFT_521818 [Trematosphaeria pertusa]